MAVLAFQTPKFQQRVKLGFIITMIILLAGRFTFGYAWQLIGDGWGAPGDDVLKLLEWPLLMMLSLIILTFYLLPIITGTRGIWGLSRRGVAWSIGFTLLFLGVHAILTFPLIRSQLGSWLSINNSRNHCLRAYSIRFSHSRTVLSNPNRMFDDGIPRISVWSYSPTRVRIQIARIL